MRYGFRASIMTLVTCAGLGLAQAPRGVDVPAKDAEPTDPTVQSPAEPAGLWTKTKDKVGHKSGDKDGECAPEWGVSVPDGPNAFEGGYYTDPHTGATYYPQAHVWASVDYLRWWIKNAPLPEPLLTTNSTGVLPALDASGTQVLIGGRDLKFDSLNGGRFTVGFTNDSQSLGISVTGFLLEQGRATQRASSDAAGNPILGRPVLNSLDSTETALFVAAPGAFAGRFAVSQSLRLWGAEANVLASRMWSGPDFIVGVRYLGLEEGLAIDQATDLLPGGVTGFNGQTIAGAGTITIGDRFETRNDFLGGQIGLQDEWRWRHFFAFASAKVALGDMHESVRVFGGTNLLLPGAAVQSTPGGLLAVGPNSILRSKDEFTVVPEFAAQVGYDINCNVRLYVGYNFLYVGDVVRPGDQISRVSNPALVPSSLQFGQAGGTSVPTPQFKTTDFWAQGLNFGVAFRF
jgi:hypothetical protein